jgi:4-carboxymuconolactone decarboxylase
LIDTIPDKKTRQLQAKEITDQMYKGIFERVLENLKALDEDFATLIEEIPYGTVYARPGLSLQQRQIASITSLTILNLKPQLKSHIIAALNVGVTKQEIVEILLHISMFVGFPLVLDAFKIAKEVFDNLKTNEHRKEL